jgi:hypothetical protein
VDGIHVPHSRNITKNDLVGPYSDDRTINLEEFVNCFTLTETEDMKCEPKVGNGKIPRTRDRAERRQKKVVEDADKEVGENGGGSGE